MRLWMLSLLACAVSAAPIQVGGGLTVDSTPVEDGFSIWSESLQVNGPGLDVTAADGNGVHLIAPAPPLGSFGAIHDGNAVGST